jgi:flagellar hook-basal body complex protein FliE
MVDPLKIPGISRGPQAVTPPNMLQPRPSAVEQPNVSFKDMLADAVSEVQNLQNEADTTIKKLVAGEITDVTEAMLAVEKADVSFQTMMTVRNKVMSAYQEIMRMQI